MFSCSGLFQIWGIHLHVSTRSECCALAFFMKFPTCFWCYALDFPMQLPTSKPLMLCFFLKKLGFSCRSCEKRPGRTQLVFEHNLPVRVTNVTKTRTFFWSKWNLLNQKITAAPLRFMLNRRPVNGAPRCLWPLTTGKSVSAYESVDFVSIAHFLGKPKWGPKPKTTNRPKC